MAPRHTIETLTGFRAFACLWIYAAHVFFVPAYDAGFGTAITLGIWRGLLRFDFLGVDLFFVLSGFLLYHLYGDRFTRASTSRQIDRFYLLRLARLYPVHLLTLLLMAAVHWTGIAHPIRSNLQDILFAHWEITLPVNLILMQAWGIVPVASWNEPAWSISALFFAYVLFPNLCLALRHIRKASMAIGGIALLLSAQAAAFAWIDGLSGSDGIGTLIRVMVFFLVGCLTSKLYIASETVAWPWQAIFLTTLTTFFAATILWVEWRPFPLILLYLFYPLLLLSLARAGGGVQRAFAHRAVLALGRWSYCLYMLHYPYLLLVKHFLGDTLSARAGTASQGELWIYFLLLTAGLMVASALCYRAVEKPCHNWLRRKLA